MLWSPVKIIWSESCSNLGLIGEQSRTATEYKRGAEILVEQVLLVHSKFWDAISWRVKGLILLQSLLSWKVWFWRLTKQYKEAYDAVNEGEDSTVNEGMGDWNMQQKN